MDNLPLHTLCFQVLVVTLQVPVGKVTAIFAATGEGDGGQLGLDGVKGHVSCGDQTEIASFTGIAIAQEVKKVSPDS